MNSSNIDYIKKFIRDQAAIILEGDKNYLIENRLNPLAQNEGFKCLDEMLQEMQSRPFGVLHSKVIDAMTTNETLFFRDIHPFEYLRKKIIPDLIAKRSAEKRLTIWCGAASSGQEPYSIAMLIREHFPQLQDWRVDFIASDISQAMLDRCQIGVYTQFEVNRGLPVIYLAKYFEKKGGDWIIKEEIRKMISFQKINLSGVWTSLPKMDIIFMRNVLIYFDVEMKKQILKNMKSVLKNDGYFFLGNGETTLTLDDGFRCVTADKTSYYQIKEQ